MYKESGVVSLSPLSLSGFDIGSTGSPRLSFSPFSPLTSPALQNTPVEDSNVLVHASADSILLQNAEISETVIRTMNPIPRGVGSRLNVGCGNRAPLLRSSFRKAKENLQSLSASIRSWDLHERDVKTGSLPGEHETRVPASTTKWTGAACTMLLTVEKGIVRTRVVLKERRKRRAGSHKAHSTPRSPAQRTDFLDILHTSEAHATINSNEPGSAKRRPQELELEIAKNDAVNDSKTRSKSTSLRYFPGDEATQEVGTNSWPREQWSSIASDQVFFTSADRCHLSSSFGSRSGGLDKNRESTELKGRGHSMFQGRRRSVEDSGVISSASISGRKTSRVFGFDSSYTSNSNSSEEERLRPATADPSARDSPTLMRPGPPAYRTDPEASKLPVPGPYNATASPSPVDLEAKAKAWAHNSQPGPNMPTEGPAVASRVGADPRQSRKQSNEATATQGTLKTRRQDATATRRKYRKAYGNEAAKAGTQQDGVVFPRETKRGERVALMKPKAKAEEAKLNSVSSCVEGRLVGDGVAVEKRSEDPFVDFRDSMVDMILEKQISKSEDLEQLLQSFLCLNPLEHHDLIVRAFSEVWEKVFGSNVKRPLGTSL